jgi:transposase-like protein
MNETPVKVRRKFDETFKREALNNWLASGKSAEVIAQELGINSNRLYAWKQRFAPAAAGGRAAAGPPAGFGGRAANPTGRQSAREPPLARAA